MHLSVIIPVYNSRRFLAQGLKALAEGTRTPDELLVVDDGSTDGSGNLAQSFGARIITLTDGPRGPARARNRGAAQARGDLLVFLDADVVVHPDTLAGIEAYFTGPSAPAALFGSYDAGPPAPGLVSRFKNLLHHFTHQHSQREASTFWAGCGALRREDFVALGGFDEAYATPAVEDIELGLRLRRAGRRILLAPEVQVTHLKAWSFTRLLRSDIFDRAVPWSRLILHEGRLPGELNLDLASRVSALATWTALACLVLGFYHPTAWLGFILALTLEMFLSRRLYRFFADKGSWTFLLGSISLHHLYLLYSSLTFALLAGLNFWEKWTHKK